MFSNTNSRTRRPHRAGHPSRVLVAAFAALVVAAVVLVPVRTPDAQAQLIDPTTQPNAAVVGPSSFFPAPNPNGYCDSRFIFGPWPTNAAPTNAVQAVGSQEVAVGGGVTATMQFTADGNIADAYPGTYNTPDPDDQTKGFEFAGGDEAVITLSEPLFYAQWVFTDVDKVNEGFVINPAWATTSREVAVVTGAGGVPTDDGFYDFTGSSVTQQVFVDTAPANNWEGYQLGGRVQVDYFGAITGLEVTRPADGNGQSGFAIGGGCVASGVAKRVAEGPTWNGSSFDVVYEVTVRNNLPSAATLATIRDFALAASPASYQSAAPQGIALSNVNLAEDLSDGRFESIVVTGLTNPTGALALNTAGFNGTTDTALLLPGNSIAAETEETILVSAQYTPDFEDEAFVNCTAGISLENQVVLTASADGVEVEDDSDDGDDANPNANNGEGGVDDATIVTFDCNPELEIVKTVASAAADCPATFDAGIVGDGPTLEVTPGQTIYYCIAIRNVGNGAAVDVTVTDELLNFSTVVDLLGAGEELVLAPIVYVVPADLAAPLQNIACAAVPGEDALCDPAIIDPKPTPTATPVPPTPTPTPTSTPVPTPTSTPVPTPTPTPFRVIYPGITPLPTATPLPTPTPTPPPEPVLAITGGDADNLSVVAVGLLALGGAFVVVARSRHRD